jgi:O-antigen ligase
MTAAAQPGPIATWRLQPALLAGMSLALLLFYQGGALVPALLGLAIFGALALWRPDLALLFVPLTVPLYMIPGALPGIRARGFDLPLHEAALLLAFVATAARWLWGRVARHAGSGAHGPAPAALLRQYAPHALFLLAGLLGVALAQARGPALIEFRRLIAEPLLFYALARWHGRDTMRRLVAALVLAGALAGLLGLLQYAGLDLVPLLGRKQCFAPDGGVCANVIADGGVRRVLSVYGHPNNLGLFLERAWPLAAALALVGFRTRRQALRTGVVALRTGAWRFVLAACLSLAGIVVSFSRGAWLGTLAAAAVLAIGLAWPRAARDRARALRLAWLLGLGAAVLVLAGLALSVRGDLRGGSTPVRLLLWREALGYIRLHPLGIGLDQFGIYHDPRSPLSLIDPVLVGTSEQFAAHPHNLLLDIWLRLGPLGLLAFGWLIVRFLRAVLRHADQPLLLGAAAAMVAALAHGLVDSFYFFSDLAIVFWLLVALAEVLGSTP